MEDNYIRVSNDFTTVIPRIAKGELKYSHYAIDNEIGYYYYLIVK